MAHLRHPYLAKNGSSMKVSAGKWLSVFCVRKDPCYQTKYLYVSLEANADSLLRLSSRTFCLLLLIESLLELIIGRVEDHCTGYYDLPLPCTRELWEVESTSEWSRRYKESLRRRKSSQVLNIQNFMSIQSSGSSRLATDPDREALVADVATWCQGVDHYGILLWMAMNMKSA